MAGIYTRWYREGTVKVVNGSTAVVGTNTYWLTAGLNPGDIFSIDGVTDYEILAITDNTHLTLKTAFTGVSDDSSMYHIIRNFTSHMPSQIAAQTAALYGDLMRYWEQDTQTVHGKSAYEIAVLHGYVGTEAEWLESLKSAGEIVSINSKLDKLYVNNAGAHNSFCRGKNLGSSITAEQIAAIRNYTYDDLYVGDYWKFSAGSLSLSAIIVKMGLQSIFDGTYANRQALTLWIQGWPNSPFNDIDTCEGHLYNSKMFTEILPDVLETLKTVIPEEYFISVYEQVADSIDSQGIPNHRTNTPCQIFLPSFHNFNWPHKSDFENRDAYVNVSKIIWPYFTVNQNRELIWTSANLNTTYWCCCNSPTNLYSGRPASSLLPVRPYIFLG